MTNRKTIVFIIASFNQGVGGHFYSLKTTAEELTKYYNVIIINVGKNKSPVLNSFSRYYPVISNMLSPNSIWKIIIIIRKSNANVIHSFDKVSCLYARIASLFTGVPFVHTKSGGPTPKYYYPKIKDIIVYSKEDMNYFNKNIRFKNTNINYIPNRAKRNEQDKDLALELKKLWNPRDIILLRIARFCILHKQSIIDSINLQKKLENDGYNLKLLLIGAIENKEIYKEIVAEANDNTIIMTKDKYTVNASRLLEVADIVVGTGRGAMEVALHNKILLCPVKNSYFPVLLSRSNFETFMYYNFSNRTYINKLNTESEYKEIKRLLSSTKEMLSHKKFLKDVAEKYFDIESVIYKYEHIYDNAKKEKLMITDMVIHTLFSIQGYLRT